MALRMVVFQIIVLLGSMNAFVKAVGLVNSSKCRTAVCGNVAIPYPFGMDTDCSMNDLYLINCSHSSGLAKPFLFLISPPASFLAPLNLEVLDISLDGTLRAKYPMHWGCASATDINFDSYASRVLVFNRSRNKYDPMGCNNFALSNSNTSENFVLCGCKPSCVDGNRELKINKSDNPISCCITAIPVFDVFSASRRSTDSPSCKNAFIVDKKWADDYTVPVVLEWRIDPTLFPLVTGNNQSDEDTSTYVCANRSSTLTCSCKPGFKGNPYLPHPERCVGKLLLTSVY